MGLSNKLTLEAGSFSCYCNPHRFLQTEVLRLYFPTLEPWFAWSVLLPSCSFRFIRTQMWDSQLPCPSSPLASIFPGMISTTAAHLCPSYLDECFFLTFSLSDFHTVRFSGSSGCFQICCCPSFGCVGRQSIST